MAICIAHEINNALTPAVGNLSILLLDRSNFSEEVAKRLELTEESIMGASFMLQQILSFSRKRPKKRQLVILTILEHTLFLLKYKFTKNQINIEKDLQSELSKIMADDAQIEQVFTNLILNAIDAMKPGGTLRINADNRAVKSEDDQPHIEMIFEDKGRGIPVEVMEHIFEPFYTTKSQGTGLGLFISYRIIVEKHGGIMDVTSMPGQGARFRVCRPAS